MERYILTRELLNFLVQIDGVLLQFGNIRITINCMHSSGSMPGGPGCEFRTLKHDNVRPA